MKWKSKKEYLEAVATELDEYSYTKRLEEELSDHYDDILYADSFRGDKNEDKTHNVAERLGEPKDIASYYNKTMRSLFQPQLTRQIIGVIFFSMVLSFVLFYLQRMFMNTTLDNSSTLDLFMQIFWIPISALVMAAFYFGALTFIDRDQIAPKRYRFIAAQLLAFPILALVVRTVFLTAEAIVRFSAENRGGRSFSEEVLSLDITGFIRTALVVAVCYPLILFLLEHPNTLASKKKRKMIHALTHLAGIAALTAVILHFASAAPQVSSALEKHKILALLVQPIIDLVSLFEFFVTIFVGVISVMALHSIILAQWILIIILLLAVLFALRSIYRYSSLRFYKSESPVFFPWIGLVVIAYAVGLFFFTPRPAQIQVDWKTPVTPLSDMIENKQFGPAGDLVRYWNADEGSAFLYALGKENGQLYVDQNSGRRFTLDLASSTQEPKFSVQRGFADREMNWGSGFKGFRDDRFECDESPLVAEVVAGDPTAVPRSCERLSYRGKLLYESGGWPQLANVVVSDDERHALMLFYNGAYDPTTVYLVPLPR